jgi:tRNA-dihydrouridine synthase
MFVASRRFGCSVVYSEMLLADRFASDPSYRIEAFGSGITDHPLVVQFASNDPETFLAAALLAQSMGADGVDLNLGCPQRRAREGHYGSWMTDQDDWDLCCAIVHTAAENDSLRIPVTVKIRLQNEAKTPKVPTPSSRDGTNELTMVNLGAYPNSIEFARRVSLCVRVCIHIYI